MHTGRHPGTHNSLYTHWRHTADDTPKHKQTNNTQQRKPTKPTATNETRRSRCEARVRIATNLRLRRGACVFVWLIGGFATTRSAYVCIIEWRIPVETANPNPAISLAPHTHTKTAAALPQMLNNKSDPFGCVPPMPRDTGSACVCATGGAIHFSMCGDVLRICRGCMLVVHTVLQCICSERCILIGIYLFHRMLAWNTTLKIICEAT